MSAVPTDNDLFAMYLAGDAEAFRTLFRHHARGLVNFAYRMLGDGALAEEVTQEAFTRLVRSPPDLTRGTKFSTYLYSVGRNLCIDEIRKRRVRRHTSLQEGREGAEGGGRPLEDRLAGDGPAPEDEAVSKEIRERIDLALAQVPETQKEVFVLREYAGLAFAEIAETVGCTENTAKSRMRYALERLRELLADIAPEEP